MKFERDQVAFVEEWTELTDDVRLWWKLFGAAAHAMHIANNFGARPEGHAIAESLRYGGPPIEDFASDFTIVAALPHTRDEMGLEVWAGQGMPVIQSTLTGRRAKKGDLALAAAGLAFLRLRDEIASESLDAFLTHLAAFIEALDWQPGERERAMFAQMGALGRLAADGKVPDLYGCAEALTDDGMLADRRSTGSDQTGESDVLLSASDRLDDQIRQAAVDDYFVLILLAASAAGYTMLCQLEAELTEAESEEELVEDEDQLSSRLIAAMRDETAADRLVRTATWNVLACVIARNWPDRSEEVVDVARSAIPLDPHGVERVLVLVGHWNDLKSAPVAEDQDDEDDDAPIPRSAFLMRIGHDGYDWICHEGVRGVPEMGVALFGYVAWSSACANAAGDFSRSLEELETIHPDVTADDPVR